MAVSAWMAAWHAGMDLANRLRMTGKENREQGHVHERYSKTISDVCAASDSVSVMLVGEVRSLEVEQSRCAAVTYAFVQCARYPPQSVLQFLADVG